jgi:peptidoglycan lytic transglycosylase
MLTARRPTAHRLAHLGTAFRLTCLLAGVLALAIGPACGQPKSKDARSKFVQALNAADAEQWPEAISLATQTNDPVAAKYIAWLRLSTAKSGATFDEIAAFLTANPDWPDRDRLRRRAEETMTPDLPAARILAWFEKAPPVSPDGAFQYARVLEAQGRVEDAAKVVQRAWTQMPIGNDQSDDFRRRFHQYIRPDDDVGRLERLLWEGDVRSARRQLRYVPENWRKLAEARIALMIRARHAERMLATVSPSLRNDPGLVFEQVRWHRRSRKMQEAVDLLLRHPKLPVIWRPDRWWREREYLVRWALSEDDAALAYKLAASHFQTEGANLAEAEWLAGWIALRKLNRPDDALRHFQTLYANVNYPVSKARAAYWLARTFEVKEQNNTATRWYREAASYVTSFYGQIAAGHLLESERPSLPKEPEPGEKDTAAFEARDLTRVVRLMADLDDRRREVRGFLLALANAAKTPMDWTLTTRLAQDAGRYDLAVSIAKLALRDGIVLSTSGYPALEPANAASEQFPDPSILHAVVRQESAFDSEAVSNAGARGLMQLMPQTALRVAHRLNVPYSKNRLTRDPTYNLRLGQAYLADMLGDYDGSLILALAAYNAGPVRVERWLQQNGDPGPSIYDAVDWTESIPFSETRNYVQRVLENLAVYRSREKGLQLALTYASIEPGPFKDSAGFIDHSGSLPVPTDAEDGDDFAGP